MYTHYADQNTGEVHDGLVETVEAMIHSDNLACNTLEEMEAWGVVDPVPYDYGYDKNRADEGVSIKDGQVFFDEICKISIDDSGLC